MTMDDSNIATGDSEPITLSVSNDSFDIKDVTFSSDSIGYLRRAGHPIFGHRIVLEDSSVHCKDCDISFDIPDIITQGSGEREALYTMYVLSKFEDESCTTYVGSPGLDSFKDFYVSGKMIDELRDDAGYSAMTSTKTLK